MLPKAVAETRFHRNEIEYQYDTVLFPSHVCFSFVFIEKASDDDSYINRANNKSYLVKHYILRHLYYRKRNKWIIFSSYSSFTSLFNRTCTAGTLRQIQFNERSFRKDLNWFGIKISIVQKHFNLLSLGNNINDCLRLLYVWRGNKLLTCDGVCLFIEWQWCDPESRAAVWSGYQSKQHI